MRRWVLIGLPVIILCFLLGAVIGYAVARPLAARREATLMRGYNPVTVLVASRKLPAGTHLAESDLKEWNVPEMFVSSSWTEPEDVPFITGAVLLFPVQPGEALLWSHLAVDKADTACQEVARYRESTAK